MESTTTAAALAAAKGTRGRDFDKRPFIVEQSEALSEASIYGANEERLEDAGDRSAPHLEAEYGMTIRRRLLTLHHRTLFADASAPARAQRRRSAFRRRTVAGNAALSAWPAPRAQLLQYPRQHRSGISARSAARRRIWSEQAFSIASASSDSGRRLCLHLLVRPPQRQAPATRAPEDTDRPPAQQCQAPELAAARRRRSVAGHGNFADAIRCRRGGTANCSASRR